MSEPIEGQTLTVTLIPVYKVELQWHRFEDGESGGYQTEDTTFSRKEDALAFVRRHRRYLASKPRARAWAAREGIEGYLIHVFPLRVCWEPKEAPLAQLAALPESMQNWQRPEWLKEED